MAVKANSSNCRLQRPRIASSGWASFDQMQRHKQGIECETDDDPFPPITSMKEQQRHHIATCCQQSKTFSSVLRSENTPKSDTYNNDQRKTSNNNVVGISSASPTGNLKKHHFWANEDLIQDILAAVNNDEQQAASVLKAMTSSDNNADDEDFLYTIAVPKGHLAETKYLNSCKLQVNQEPICNTGEQLTSKHSFVAPVEPEWEEDDVYLTHRREAIKMMRAASKHSRAAANAFSRGDRSSAHQFSVQAKGERAAAEVLNSKAAREIVSIRNGTNDIWKLDLHGLHASEAVNILKEHLTKIESMQILALPTHSDEPAKLVNPPLLSESASIHNIDAATRNIQALYRPRQMVLHVITGTGNHRRGEAALPMAVRGFLIENGYRFDDVRPGVLAVRTKFRLR